MTDQDYKGRKVAFYTLGCKLNFAESSAMARKFEEIGFERVNFKQLADVYVLNSCTVTAESDKKSRNFIRSAIRRNRNALVMVTGCYAQISAVEIAKIHGVDYILGAAEKGNITNYINNFQKNEHPIIRVSDFKKIDSYFSAYSFGDRTRTFLKVQDGCNYFCTYCTIPFARGKSRNDSIENTIAEARKVVESGSKEIILTGVNIGDFGQSTGESFFDLLQALDKVAGLERIRISSVEPDLLSDEIIRFVASSQHIVPHFHLPLQAGSNQVLQLMKRRYTRELFASRIETIKKLMPHAFIGVDVIAGTNGETHDLFVDSYTFLENLDFSQLHVFPYSERKGTMALKIPHVVPVPERKQRVQKYMELSVRKHRLFIESQLGKTLHVLFEHKSHNGLMYGWTENYVRVKIPYDKNLDNKIYNFELQTLDSDGVVLGQIK